MILRTPYCSRLRELSSNWNLMSYFRLQSTPRLTCKCAYVCVNMPSQFRDKRTMSTLEWKWVLSYVYIPVSSSAPGMEGYMPLGGGGSFLKMYPRWSLCIIYLLACQVRVTLGESCLCCCVPYYTCDVSRTLLLPFVCRLIVRLIPVSQTCQRTS